MQRGVRQLVEQFNKGVRNLEPDGYILQGSVVRRYLRHTTAGGEKTYGPYYIWTRKQAGKSVTMALSKEQADLIRSAIRRQRALEQRLTRMRSLSERIIRTITTGVPTRNRAKSAP